MQNRSETWIENQAEVLSAPTELVAIVESQEPVPGSDPISRRWVFGNQQTINNLVEARLEFPFDPTRTTLPIQSSTLKIENATNYDEGLPPVPDYDFSQPANMEALGFPTTIYGNLGFRYPDDTVEQLPAFRHSLIDAKIDDFDTYVTLNGESFLSQLDKGTFYGGRYAATGIDAATLIEEILSDVAFKGEGGWNYIIGKPNCTVSTTQPLWRDSGFDYWVIDPELARFKVYIPIPPVSHREALQYVASYVGADVWVNRDGQIVVSRGLYSGDAPDYILDIGRVYERPKRIRPLTIGAVESKIMQYNYETTASEIANVSVVVPSGDLGETKAYRLTHDACHEGSLTLTGATLVGTPHYYTYSTEFLASTTNATFTAVLTGKKVSLVERAVTFPFVEGGTTATYSNPIASDETYLRSAIHEYVRMATSPQYEISMRDDPAIDNGDRLMLEQVQSAEPTPIVVANISREMTGALDATYQVYENRNRYVEDFSALDDNDSVIGYDGWVSSDPSAGAVKRTIGGTPLIEVQVTAESVPDVIASDALKLASHINTNGPAITTPYVGATGYEFYSTYWVSALAYLYSKTLDASVLTACETQWDYVKTLIGTGTTDLGFWRNPVWSTTYYNGGTALDHHGRYLMDAYAASKLLEQSGATTLAAEMLGAVDDGMTALMDVYPAGSATVTGNASNQPLRTNSTVYAYGDVVKLPGGQVLWCSAEGTSGLSAPAAPGPGNTVTDGTVTWTQERTTFRIFPAVITTTPGATGAMSAPNQHMWWACAAAALYKDTGSAWYGSAELLDAISEHVEAAIRFQLHKPGDVSSPSADGLFPHSTSTLTAVSSLYHAATAAELAMLYRMLGTDRKPRLAPVLARARQLVSVNFEAKPDTAYSTSSGWYFSEAEADVWNGMIYRVLGTSYPHARKMLTNEHHDADGDYTPSSGEYGGVTADVTIGDGSERGYCNLAQEAVFIEVST